MDWLFLLLFALLALRGWLRGLIREVIGLAVVVVGLFLAFRLSTPFGVVVESIAGTSADVSRLIAGIVIILAIGIGATIVANVLHYGIKLMPGLSTLNRAAGAAFSLLAGAIVLAVVVSIVSLLPIPSGLADELDESTFASTVTDPDGVPQRVIGFIAGDRVVAAILSVQQLFGESLVVAPDNGSVPIPPAQPDEIRITERAADNAFNQLNRTRAAHDAAPLVRSQVLDDQAVVFATDLYTQGSLGEIDADRRLISVRLAAAGIPVQGAEQITVLASSPRAATGAIAGDPTSLEELIDRDLLRVGIGVAKGPLGLIVVVILTD